MCGFEFGEEAEPVTAHAGVAVGDVVAEPVLAEHVVLGARHVGSSGAGADGGDARLERLAVERVRAALRRIGLADNEGAADLRVIALDRRRQLGRHEIAGGDDSVGRRRHAEHLAPARAQDHEIVGQPLARKNASTAPHSSYCRRPGMADLRKTA